jgi:hypothetical protein
MIFTTVKFIQIMVLVVNKPFRVVWIDQYHFLNVTCPFLPQLGLISDTH